VALVWSVLGLVWIVCSGTFIMEYVGEVLDYRAFKCRTRRYARDNHEHHYFMALSADEVIDAAKKGNVSRFINHCCDPNAETQKVYIHSQSDGLSGEPGNVGDFTAVKESWNCCEKILPGKLFIVSFVISTTPVFSSMEVV